MLFVAPVMAVAAGLGPLTALWAAVPAVPVGSAATRRAFTDSSPAARHRPVHSVALHN
jgi:hypothetical protein